MALIKRSRGCKVISKAYFHLLYAAFATGQHTPIIAAEQQHATIKALARKGRVGNNEQI